MKRVLTLVFLLLSLYGTAAIGAIAQEATPTGNVVPDPADCTIEPRSVDELIALWYAPNSMGTPEVIATPMDMEEMAGTPVDTLIEGATPAARDIAMPAGEPAKADTIDGVTRAVYGTFACFNAGDFPRALAHYSDDLVRQSGPGSGTSVEDALAFLTADPVALPEGQRLAIKGVIDVTLLPDGRVAALVVSVDPTVDPNSQATDLVYFIKQGDRWLVDKVVEGPTSKFAATPTP